MLLGSVWLSALAPREWGGGSRCATASQWAGRITLLPVSREFHLPCLLAPRLQVSGDELNPAAWERGRQEAGVGDRVQDRGEEQG